jgi:hypothetical protein
MEPVSQDRPETTSPFAERRQARGWVTWQWAVMLITIVVWIRLILNLTLDPDPGAVAGAFQLLLLLGILGFGVWGYRASAGAQKGIATAAQARGLGWWERDRFAMAQAARRLGWSPAVTVWVSRGLMVLAGSLMVLTALLFFTRG